VLWVLAVAPGVSSAQESLPLHGFVREAATGEAVGYASITLVESGRVVAADRDGYFRAGLVAAEAHRVRIAALGYATLDTVLMASRTPVELLLRSAPVEMAALVADARRAPGERDFEAPEVSVRSITPTEARRVPAALEADLFRSLQALPGVVSPGVLSSRLMVRGGAADQNLFLLDGYPVIYPYHLAGAFSAFHLDAVRDAEFYMGAPPARYGGRLSSVLDVSLRDGNRERMSGAASLGVVTSSAVVEGPHPAGAWFVGARRTYIDQIVRGAKDEIPYHFYDAYAKSYVDLGANDRISALIFLGRDATWRAGRRDDDFFRWSNDVYGVSWRRLLGGRATWEQRLSFSSFDQELSGGGSRLQAASIGTRHRTDLAVASGVLRAAAGRHEVRAGYSAERQNDAHRIGYTWGFVRDSTGRAGESRSTLYAGYVEDDVALFDALRVRLGLRAEASGAYTSLQPRFAARYLLSDDVALSLGAGLIRQYSHLLQDPDATIDIYNVDIWLSSHEADVPAARSAHLIGGVEAALPRNLRLRAEAYYKGFDGLQTLAPYDPVSREFAIERLEDATGHAAGVDLSLGREVPGRLSGWVGYSLARSRLDVDGTGFAADPHPRHRVVAVAEAPYRRNWHLSGRLELVEGIPFTAASATAPRRPPDMGSGRFVGDCQWVGIDYLYGSRNSARTTPSKRLDIGAARRWTSRRNWKWEVSLSLLNALFDPTGVFQPKPVGWGTGCTAPEQVAREQQLVLPPIPSAAIRIEF
jgi:hypothetical protein